MSKKRKEMPQSWSDEEITAHNKNKELNPDLLVLRNTKNCRKIPRPKHGPKQFFKNQE
jgi:hypothetical protein